MPIIPYNTGTPTEVGVYACRVLVHDIPGLFDDIFLIWVDGKWGYCGSDQKYRGSVAGWVGPLQRKMI